MIKSIRENATLLVTERQKIQFLSSICFNTYNPSGEATVCHNNPHVLIKCSESVRFVPFKSGSYNSSGNLELNEDEAGSHSFPLLPALKIDDGDNNASDSKISIDVNRGFFATNVASSIKKTNNKKNKEDVGDVGNNNVIQDCAANSIFCVICNMEEKISERSFPSWTIGRFVYTTESTNANSCQNTIHDKNIKQSSRKRKSRSRLDETVDKGPSNCLPSISQFKNSYRLVQRYDEVRKKFKSKQLANDEKLKIMDTYSSQRIRGSDKRS